MKLSILIPCTEDRVPMLGNLFSVFNNQLPKQTDEKIISEREYQILISIYDGIEIIVCMDNKTLTIGAKRNILMDFAKGKYLAGFDSDDLPTDVYIKKCIEVVDSCFDCGSLKGEITIDGSKPEIFEHSLKYNEWKTNMPDKEIRYERYINHLNCVKSEIAKQIKYPEKNHGEDFDWSMELKKSELLKTEYYIPEIIYNYNYISNK